MASSVKTIEGGFPSEKEKRQVLIWLKRSNLNRYGDRFGTDYRGGNPLYNPITGVMTSRYQYLVNRHPSKPWLAVDLRQVPDNLEDDEAAE